ncbi:MAG: HPr family phosphocarrier protein [Calditerrivibrio sp.]|nr:HPr family phosphocarrier protein [Calditerrivibrio sp.]
MEELHAELEIINALGLHARAAALFVKVASKYKSEVKVSKNGLTANGKSIMGVMMLAAPKGSKIMLTVKGTDAREALEELSELVRNKFGEME